ncbi:hypothetical protein [Photobacterium damselae]|uniref:Phage tail protein n=2 Tax=Photobacterium damselae TaxID=38293 RepID=D0YX05_PHODD|nr:hypothetical protein [Photobacterium damselae]EEZ41026.1 hypothetical protein VDA_002058 [Photobacterium damselae subsp. damselae CIP 102761]PSW83607.1 hypothetical protein CTN07_16425 [Photobacterium damselae]SPY28269.1 Uncharacterised protein [Photobacterium damselae]
MGLEQQISSLVQASENLTGAVNNKIGEIDKEVVAAKTKFEQFLGDADNRFMTRVGIYVHVSGDDDKFYPVYIPASHPGVTDLQINRSVHFDREWAGGLSAKFILQNSGWGGYPDIFVLDALGHVNHPTKTPIAVKTDGFIADYLNGGGFVAGAIFWLRGNHKYLISSSLRAFTGVITHEELVTTNIFEHGNIRIFKSGFHVTASSATVACEVKTARNQTKIPTLSYIRGV